MNEAHMGVAGGVVRVCRFVKVSTATDKNLLEADANEAIVGISGDAALEAPIPNSSANAATAANDPMRWHPIGSVCKLFIGSGGVTRGDEIKSDADGKGVKVATTGTTIQEVGAIALESAIENDLADVLVVRYPRRPALA